MRLTREADYALRTMLEVAARPSGELMTTTRVSRRRLVPLPFVRKIVPRLCSAGLLESRRGNGGGLALARPAEDITLLQVIDAVRPQSVAVNRCVLDLSVCPLQPICPVHDVCRIARDRLVEVFGSAHLSDAVARGAELTAARRRRRSNEGEGTVK